ncbi:MAG: response regulator [Bacteroidota bacterium]
MRKVIIVDDEDAGRKLIKEYLMDFPEWVVISEANNGVDAVREINKFRPDLLFLDIQMPGLTGFEVLHHLEQLPQIIFSTAYDKYALQAFDVHAVDYLLKPYTKDRFRRSLEKLNFEESQKGLMPLTADIMLQNKSFPERILVEFQKKFINVKVSDIIWIEAYGDYSKLHGVEQVYVSNFGISQLEEKLDPSLFLRVHRSSIININKIEQMNKFVKSYDIKMNNGDVVRVSRGYMQAVKQLIF